MSETSPKTLTQNQKWNRLVKERVLGQKKKTVPKEHKGKYGYAVSTDSSLFKDIVQRAINEGVILKLSDAYKGVTYEAKFDGWCLSYSINYSDSYKAGNNLPMKGTDISEWEPDDDGQYLYILPDKSVPNFLEDPSADYAVLEHVVGTWDDKMQRHFGDYLIELWEDRSSSEIPLNYMPGDYSRAALATKNIT